MKKVLFSVAIASIALSSCNKKGKIGTIALNSTIDSVSYCIGNSIGKNLAQDNLTDLNEKVFMNAMRQAFNNEEVQIDGYKAQMLISKYITKAKTLKAEKAKEEGEKFLAQNKSKSGIKVTESGLQYKVIKEGKGAKPVDTSIVKVHYKGTLVDGTEFDSSFKRNEPTTFPVNKVIRGWTEGLKLMSVGSKYHFFIPSELAYGARGAGNGMIPGNATLIFEIELLESMTPEEANAKKEEERQKKINEASKK